MNETVRTILNMIREESKSLSVEDMKTLANGVWELYKNKGADIKALLYVGARVHCPAGNKSKDLGIGTIEKLNPKRAKVKFDSQPWTTWTVPYNMIQFAEEDVKEK